MTEPRTQASPEQESVSGPLDAGRSAMQLEAEAIRLAANRLDEQFLRAVELLQRHAGKTIVTGIGKSGCVARKLAATLCSTGTSAVFLHPVEASHGDLGIYATGDPTILISKSGTTLELVRLIPALRQLESPLIGIVGNRLSPLGKAMDVLLDSSVRAEADPTISRLPRVQRWPPPSATRSRWRSCRRAS